MLLLEEDNLEGGGGKTKLIKLWGALLGIFGIVLSESL